MDGIKFAESQSVLLGTLLVNWSDGTVSTYSATDMGVEWFKMSNDDFFKKYGFNFNPHEYPGLYEKCRRIAHADEETALRSAT